jgi:DNA mismatch repair protein MutS2
MSAPSSDNFRDFQDRHTGRRRPAEEPGQGQAANLRSSLDLLEFDKILESLAGQARSVMAAEICNSLQPLPAGEEIRARLAEATTMQALLDAGENFPLDALPDIRPALKQLAIAGRILEPRQLVDLALMLATTRRVRCFLHSHREKYALLFDIAANLMIMQDLEQAVEAAISLTDLSIKDSASPALARVRKEISRAQTEAHDRLRRILKSLADRDMVQEQVITRREGRLVLMLKDEFRHRVPGLVHDESASGHTVFIEPMESVEVNNRIRQLLSAEREEIERILLALSDRFRGRLPQIEQNLNVLVRFDVIQAKARLARRLNAAAPQIVEPAEGRLSLLAARHPLLLLRGGDPQNIVALDLDLGGDFFTLILTGPNAGGKTVALKTVGLLSLMALSGLPIPAAADSTVPHFRRIFSDIGDRQSIENDLSTFTSHMARLVEILASASSADLVLLDEIGSGTDPDEGAALAVAILRALTERRCLTLTTTHHGALKAFAHEQPGVRNGSMAFDSATLQPTYRYHAGIPGSSYAFEIAARLGLDAAVINDARAGVGVEKINVEQLSADLERRLAEQRQLMEKLKLEEIRLTGLSKLYEDRAARLKTNESALRQQAVEESARILQRANAAVEEAIRKIRESEASRESIREAKEKLVEARREMENEAARLAQPQALSVAPLLHEMTVGMPVWWGAKAARAIIAEPPDAQGRVLVEMGNLKARVPLAELQPFSEQKAAAIHAVDRVAEIKESRDSLLPEIDVRGQRVDEAVAAVDKFIDDAIIAGWSELRIIHGKGTGALRQSISDFLAKHPHVAGARQAPLGAGDAGVTLVSLK